MRNNQLILVSAICAFVALLLVLNPNYTNYNSHNTPSEAAAFVPTAFTGYFAQTSGTPIISHNPQFQTESRLENQGDQISYEQLTSQMQGIFQPQQTETPAQDAITITFFTPEWQNAIRLNPIGVAGPLPESVALTNTPSSTSGSAAQPGSTQSPVSPTPGAPAQQPPAGNPPQSHPPQQPPINNTPAQPSQNNTPTPPPVQANNTPVQPPQQPPGTIGDFPTPRSTQNEPVGRWWSEIVTICHDKWGLDPYFIAAIVKHESWFDERAENQAEKNAYESGAPVWFEQYYGKGLMQPTGPWIGGTPFPREQDWQWNMPPETIRSEAPRMDDALNGTQNLDRGCWYYKAMIARYHNDYLTAAAAFHYGWFGVDGGGDNRNSSYAQESYQYYLSYIRSVNKTATIS